jgi:hypothetical protein
MPEKIVQIVRISHVARRTPILRADLMDLSEIRHETLFAVRLTLH